MPLPRAQIFHGTTCISHNKTIINRNINAIAVARFMVERPAIVKGLSIDEFAVISCSALVDEIWVPTPWHETALRRMMSEQGYAIQPSIAVIGESVDTTLFDPINAKPQRFRGLANLLRSNRELTVDPTTGLQQEQQQGEGGVGVGVGGDERFEFLSAFKWEYRKGWDVLLSAYWRAFTATDKVVLRLRTYIPKSDMHMYGSGNITRQVELFARDKFNKELHELAFVVWEQGTGGVNGSDSALTREDMRDLYASADAFVLPTRGEGWGLPIAEAMAMATPTIVSYCPGPQFYASNDNAYLIPILTGEDAFDDLGYAQPDSEALEKILTQVIFDSGPNGKGEAKRRGLNGREKMAELQPYDMARKMAERLRFLARRRGWDNI
jgi:glycosyltransferase involved in cell wall biosynthesis